MWKPKRKLYRFLDSRPVTPAERDSAKNRIRIIQVVKALQEDLCPEDSIELMLGGHKATPLEKDQDMEQRAGFGKRSYVYKGKNSEGNKFISNDDLWVDMITEGLKMGP